MLRKIGFFLLIALLLWIAAEVSLRAYFSGYFKEHPLLCKRSNIPGLAYVNAGLRFNTFEHPKDRPRIVILGDYVSLHPIRGGQAGDASYPQLLDEKLSHKYEIINTSALFYSLPEEMVMLKNKAVYYDPDIVIVGHVLNDLFLGNPGHITVALEIKSSMTAFKSIIPCALRYIRILGQDRRYQAACSHPSALAAETLRDYRDKEKVALLQKALDQLKTLSQERGFRVIFVVIPVFVDFNDKELNAVNDIIIRECRLRQIPSVDLLSVFRKYNVADVKQDDGDIWHQNAKGNQIIAAQIYEKIIAKQDFR